jgi:hypothetical protein
MIWSNAATGATVKKYRWFAAGFAAAFIVNRMTVADIYKANFVWLNRWIGRAEWRHYPAREIDEDVVGNSHSSNPLATSLLAFSDLHLPNL